MIGSLCAIVVGIRGSALDTDLAGGTEAVAGDDLLSPPDWMHEFVTDIANARNSESLLQIPTGYPRAKSEVIIEILNPPAAFKEQGESGLQAKFAPNYDLDTDKANNLIKLDTYNQDYVLNMRVKVPRKTDLDLDTYYDGYLQVKDVSGQIKTRSQNCDIRLLDISGSATAFGYNGLFTIRFKQVASDARLDFESYNGGVDLTLPASIKATTAISTGNGTYFTAFDIESIDEHPIADFPKIVGDNVSEYQFGTVNGGGIPIRIESEKGKIVLRKPEL